MPARRSPFVCLSILVVLAFSAPARAVNYPLGQQNPVGTFRWNVWSNWADAGWQAGPKSPAGWQRMIVNDGAVTIDADASGDLRAMSVAIGSDGGGTFGTVTVNAGNTLQSLEDVDVTGGGQLAVDGTLSIDIGDLNLTDFLFGCQMG